MALGFRFELRQRQSQDMRLGEIKLDYGAIRNIFVLFTRKLAKKLTTSIELGEH